MKFRSFYNRYKDMLFAYLMRACGDYYLSGDIMQESFTRYLDRYGKREPSAPLLFKIARNALLDHRRRSNRSTHLDEENEPKGENPEYHLMVRDEYRRTLYAMQQLEEAERDVLSLVVSSDMSYRKIAEIHNTSEQNIKVRVHRARVKLRKILGGRD
ncbi:MAG: sigma-70 family RNA polymerase sigma factor [Desulfobacterales bacterium]